MMRLYVNEFKLTEETSEKLLNMMRSYFGHTDLEYDHAQKFIDEEELYVFSYHVGRNNHKIHTLRDFNNSDRYYFLGKNIFEEVEEYFPLFPNAEGKYFEYVY